MIAGAGRALGLLFALVTSLAVGGNALPSSPEVPGAPSELVEQRSETTTVYQHADGSRTVVLSGGPIRVRRGDVWVPVDLTLHRDPDGGVRPAAHPYPVWLSGGGAPAGLAAAVHGADGVVTALPWPAPLPAPLLQGSRATYPGAAPGADLVVEVTRSGFVASLRGSAPPAPSAAMAVAGDPAATATRGELALRVSRPGTTDVIVPADRSAGVATTDDEPPPVSRVVATADDGPALPFDTTVQNTVLNTDLSADPDLRLGTHDGASVARGYLTWNLDRLRGRPIRSATLRLYATWSASCQERGWEVWSSPPVGPATRWPSQPLPERLWASSTATRGHDGSCAPAWASVDVTDMVRSWLDVGAASSSGSAMLRAVDETDPLGWKRFSAGDGPNVPTLTVTLGS